MLLFPISIFLTLAKLPPALILKTVWNIHYWWLPLLNKYKNKTKYVAEEKDPNAILFGYQDTDGKQIKPTICSCLIKEKGYFTSDILITELQKNSYF